MAPTPARTRASAYKLRESKPVSLLSSRSATCRARAHSPAARVARADLATIDSWLEQVTGNGRLACAAREGLAREVGALIQLGVDIEVVGANGNRPLHFAANSGSVEATRALLDARADQSATNANGNTPLHLAAGSGHAENVSTLLVAGSPKDARNKRGRTPLHVATERGNADIVGVLLASGADKAILDDMDQTAMEKIGAGVCTAEEEAAIMSMFMAGQ